jgi:hypothetical protein
METKFTEQESLAVITEMIDRARHNIQQGAGNSMIFWGFFIASIAILNIILAFLLPNPNMSFWAWTLCVPGVLVDSFIQKKTDREAMIKTHVDKIVSAAWRGFFLANVCFLVIIFVTAYFFKNPQFFFLITPIILLMAGIAEMITSVATRFKPFMWGATGMYIGSILCVLAFFVTKEIVVVQFLILATCMIFGFVIPGIKLNKLAKSHA